LCLKKKQEKTGLTPMVGSHIGYQTRGNIDDKKVVKVEINWMMNINISIMRKGGKKL